MKTTSTQAVIGELERIGYRVNGDTWQWNVSDEDGKTGISDGQEGADVDGAKLAGLLAEIPADEELSDETFGLVWDAIQESEY